MAKIEYQSVDEYIVSFPDEVRVVLERVRGTILKAVKGLEESISYGMPTYKLRGERVLFFAGWKRHYSLYPASDVVIGELADELAAYEVHKGTIRFPLDAPVPVKLIGRIAKLRVKEAGQRVLRKTQVVMDR